MATQYGPEPKKEDKDLLRVFCPHVRVLSHEEIEKSLTLQKVESIEAGDQGVWLEVLCPKDECLRGGDKIILPARGAGRGKTEDLWLKVFCPESECEISSPTDVP